MLKEDVEMLINLNLVMSEAAKNVTLRKKTKQRVGEYKEAENKNEGSKRLGQTSVLRH